MSKVSKPGYSYSIGTDGSTFHYQGIHYPHLERVCTDPVLRHALQILKLQPGITDLCWTTKDNTNHVLRRQGETDVASA